MNTPTNNPCSRCGQERIVQASRTEELVTAGGVSTVKYTSMICPDPACQAELEKSLAKSQEQRDERNRIKEEQAQSRINKTAPAK